MRKLKQKLKVILLVASIVAGIVLPASTMAASDPCHPENNTPPGQALSPDELKSCESCQGTSSSADCLSNNLIVRDLNVIVNFLSGLVGIVVIGTLILGGIQYTMAGGSPEAVNKAKQRITNGVLALVAYLLIFGILQWLVPGGLFNS